MPFTFLGHGYDPDPLTPAAISEAELADVGSVEICNSKITVAFLEERFANLSLTDTVTLKNVTVVDTGELSVGKQAELLSQLISKQPGVRHLSISHFSLRETDIRLICAGLPSLETLQLFNVGVDEGTILSSLTAAQAATKITFNED